MKRRRQKSEESEASVAAAALLLIETSLAGEMGASVTRAAQWTSSGKLESTPMNESLLGEILCFVEQFSSQHPLEAEHVFEAPLQWSTTLVASDFKTDYDISDSDVQSHEKDGEGLPLLQLSPPTVYVRSFSQLSKLVHLADDKKLEEVRACLEENREPVVKILGPCFASILDGEDTHSEIQRLVDDDQVKDSEVKIRLFHLFQNTDKQILSKLLEEISEQVRLDPTAVKNDMELLKRFCSEGENRVLKSVRYTSDYEFTNGCRAPLWRQVHGEICHLVIEPCDTDELCITCSTTGVFLNGGIKHERAESGYERTSDMYEDLVTLLKSRSPYFAENMNKQLLSFLPYQQDSAVEELPSTQRSQHVESVDKRNKANPRGLTSNSKRMFMTRRDNSMRCTRRAARGYMNHVRDGRLSVSRLHVGIKAEEKKSSKSPGEERSGATHMKKPGAGAKSKIKAEFSVSSIPGHLSSQKIKTPAGAMPVELSSESSLESEEEEDSQSAGRPDSHCAHSCAMMDFDLMQETCQLAIRY
ncbi:hypothetical protein INR49_024027, partial [Caranx melampygus]